MSKAEWDGADLLEALRHAAATLIADVDEVNALNVFPVPDGDTGSNMVATVNAALDDALGVPPEERTVPRIAGAFAFGALMGARGNSGVILSQLFRGVSAAVDGESVVGSRQLASALQRGRDAAYSAVATPVEGTILTVATDAAAGAAEAASAGESLERVLAACVAAAADSVQRTPERLPLLAQAGVVDAGGRGLELLLRGALGFAQGKELPTVVADRDVALPDFDALEEDGFGYETVYVVTPPPGQRLDVVAMRERLGAMGESVLVGGDERAAKIHIHNGRPDEVIRYGLTLGSLSRIVVENLDRQAHEVRQHGATQRIRMAVPPTSREAVAHGVTSGGGQLVALPAGPAVVAVAAGRGLARMFAENGASAVVEGGPTANPAAADMVAAIRGAGREQVLVLPNNPNVRLAAQQAADLVPDVEVAVVPTRNAAEGIAALLAIDARKGLEENAARMERALREIKTFQVTAAVRDATIGGQEIRQGDHLVLDPDDGLLACAADRTDAVLAAVRGLEPDFELMTIYRGKGVNANELEALRDALASELPGVEIELVDGGQPHYSLLISAE